MCESQADGAGGVLGMLVSWVNLPLGVGLRLWSIRIEDDGMRAISDVMADDGMFQGYGREG